MLSYDQYPEFFRDRFHLELRGFFVFVCFFFVARAKIIKGSRKKAYNLKVIDLFVTPRSSQFFKETNKNSYRRTRGLEYSGKKLINSEGKEIRKDS